MVAVGDDGTLNAGFDCDNFNFLILFDVDVIGVAFGVCNFFLFVFTNF